MSKVSKVSERVLFSDFRKYKELSLYIQFFYQREGFIIQCEGLDEATGEKERPVSVQDMSLARIGEL